MTYPKTRITRSRSRSRNMRKKHLVKSKRNNRSRKSKKNHSRKYRGGDSAVAAEDIQAIIDAGNAKAMTDSDFAKLSFHFNTIKSYLAESRPGDPHQITPGDTPTFIGSSSGGALEHFLYRSINNAYRSINNAFFLVHYKPGTGELTVYYLNERRINYIRTHEENENRGERARERAIEARRRRITLASSILER